MERAANASAAEYSRYGSTVHKQVYIYGGLDRSAIAGYGRQATGEKYLINPNK